MTTTEPVSTPAAPAPSVDTSQYVVEDPLQPSLRPGGVHHRLAQLAGDWEGTTRTWFRPNELADESPTRGRIRPILGGGFLLHEYESTLCGEPRQGLEIIGYELGTGRFTTAWVDNHHNGTTIMLSRSAPGTPGDAPHSVLGHYRDPSGGPDWGWRTEITLEDPDRLTITAYNITPSGEEAKAVETTYRRARA